MPEQDVLADAFADLVATAEITSPGPAAARRTVRRRRATVRAVAAVAAVAVVGGAAYLAAVRPGAVTPAAVPNPLPELPTTVWSDAGRLSARPVYSDDFKAHPVGWYQVRFMCTGGGREFFTLTVAGGSSSGDASVACDGQVQTLTIGTVRDAENAFIRVAPDPADPAGAGTWALRVDYTTEPPATK